MAIFPVLGKLTHMGQYMYLSNLVELYVYINIAGRFSLGEMQSQK